MSFFEDNIALVKRADIMFKLGACIGAIHHLLLIDITDQESSSLAALHKSFAEMSPDNIAYLERQLKGLEYKFSITDFDDADDAFDFYGFFCRNADQPYLVELLLPDPSSLGNTDKAAVKAPFWVLVHNVVDAVELATTLSQDRLRKAQLPDT